MKQTLKNILILIAIISLTTACKKDKMANIPNVNEYNLYENKVTLSERVFWSYNAEYNLNLLQAKKQSETLFSLTLPANIEKDETYMVDANSISLMLAFPDQLVFTAKNDVKITITEYQSGELNYIKGKYKGTFFYVENAQTQDVEISGEFTAFKR